MAEIPVPIIEELERLGVVSIDPGKSYRHFTGYKKPRGYCYFVQSGRSGPVKIGYAAEPWIRLGTLQGANHSNLNLRAMAIDDSVSISLERWFHDRFSPYRIRGEWFKFCPEIAAVIAWLQITARAAE